MLLAWLETKTVCTKRDMGHAVLIKTRYLLYSLRNCDILFE
jgi:hypothetical protein